MYVYFIAANSAQWQRVKIGYAKDVEARLSEMQIGSPVKLSVLGKIACASLAAARALEISLHKRFDEYVVAGEWFALKAPLREFIAAINFADADAARRALNWAERQMRTKAQKRARFAGAHA